MGDADINTLKMEQYLALTRGNMHRAWLNTKSKAMILDIVKGITLNRIVRFMKRSKALRKLSMKSLDDPFQIIMGMVLDIMTKIEECKAIFTKDGLPLHTPFYYSQKEIIYFSANLSFLDKEIQKETRELEEIDKVTTYHERAPREETPGEPPMVSYYMAPYEPSISFLRRLEKHAEEALVYKTMDRLKRIKLNRPLLKEIRQTDDYAKNIKNLVANKSITLENEYVKMKMRCSVVLQDHLPLKEQDPGSFILP
nr:hypothetical protein [Tanacetum cinerariifolium]